MKQDIVEYFSKLGLTELETKVYLGLLKTGPSTVLRLSRQIGVKRATTHGNIESLIEKGLITQTKTGKRRKLVPEPLDRINFILEQKKWDLKKLEEKLPIISDEIKKEFPITSKPLKVETKYFEGKKAVKHIYEDVLTAQEIRSYVNAVEIAKAFPENMDVFIKTHNQRKDMKIWEILTKSVKIREYAQQMAKGRYYYKFVPKELTFSVIDYLIYDGKVAIVTARDNITGLIIQNVDYYENAKLIFNFVWQVLN